MTGAFHSAGISLHHADGGPLVMQLPDGVRLQAPLAGLKWPAQAHDLPVGPLRDALAPLIAPRALMPVVTVRSASQEARVLDAEEKTVARLRTESVDDGTSQLRIQPLRGYDAEADRIARLLARVDGFSAVSATPYDLALTHAGRSPANGSHPGVALQPETSAAVAIAQMLTGFATAIEENVPGTIRRSTPSSCTTCGSRCVAAARFSSSSATCCPTSWPSDSPRISSGSAI